MQESELYYESHITIEPVFDERLEDFRKLCEPHKFKPASLLMKKRKEDTAERSQYDTFATGHGKLFDDISARTIGLVEDLKAAGFKVWRYKIEDTMLDSRHEDVFGLLGD